MKSRWFLVGAGIICQVMCSILISNHRPKPQNQIERYDGEVVVSSAPLSIKSLPKGFPVVRTERSTDVVEGRHSKKGRGGMMKKLKKMWPYMLVPAMMTMGYAPFVLSSLKMFVMNAVMLNMMALNAAIFLTLRNLVFGPRIGQHIKYYNFGYKKKPHQHHFR